MITPIFGKHVKNVHVKSGLENSLQLLFETKYGIEMVYQIIKKYVIPVSSSVSHIISRHIQHIARSVCLKQDVGSPEKDYSEGATYQ
jgi:hypothetical protein